MLAGSLELELFANVARLQKDMDEAKRAVGGAMATIERTVGGAMKVLGALGGALSVAAFANMAKEAINLADEISKLSQKAGIATETLSQLRYVADLSGVSSESLSKGIKKLNISIAEGIGGDKEKIAMFQSLGVTLKDTEGRTKSADRVLLEMADTFAKSRDGATKTAVAVGLLGKAGDDMVPMLNGGSQAIIDMMAEADKLGLTINSEFAKDAEAFNDNLSRIGTQAQSLAIIFGQEFVSGLGKAMQAMADATVKGNALKGIIAGIQTLLTGDDTYKAEKNVVNLFDDYTKIQGEIDKLKGAAIPGLVANRLKTLEAERDRIKAALDLNRNYLASLNEQAETAKKAADAINTVRTSGAEIKYTKGAGDSAAAAKKAAAEIQKLREQELKFLMDWGRADAIRQGEAVIEANKEYADSLAKATAEYADLIEAQDKAAVSLRGEVQAQKDSNKHIGLTADAIAASGVAKLREDAISKDRLATIADEIDWTGALGEAYRAQAASLRELAQLKSEGAFDQKQIDDFKSVWDSVDKTAHDTFTNIFEGGQNAFSKLRDTLKATLLDMLYQMTVRKWVFNIAANVTGAGGNAVSAVSSASGLMGNSGGLLGGIMGGGMSLANMAGSAVANVTGTGISGLLATNGAFGTAAGAGAGLMGTIGAAIPWIGGIIALASMFGGKRGGPKDTGSFGTGFLGDVFTRDDTQPQFNSTAKSITDAIGFGYAGAAASLGIKAGDLQSGAFFAIDNKGEGDAQTQLRTASYLNGNLVYDRNNATQGGNFEDVGRTPEELQAAIDLASARAVLSALKASDLPAQLQSYFDALDPLAMSAEQITAALDLAKAAKQFTEQIGFMGEGLSNLAGLSVKATTELAAAAGGMDALQSKFATYYQAFYTEEERAAASLASVTDAMTGLGYSSVDTIAEFRDLVESINPVDDASRALLATLLDIAPAFAAAHAEGETFVENLIDGMSAAASKYFAGVDAAAMADDLFGDAASGIDKFLGTTVKSVADSQMEQAQAAISAARTAASLWGNAKASIESAINDVRDLGNLISPSASRSKSLSQLDRATMAALGGDATAAASVGELAKGFLAASKSSSVDRLDYLRDRAMADAKLVSVLDKAKSQITLQESIANASEAMVSQLQTINQSLTGFGAQVYELLTKGYAGADRETASSAAEKLAKATSDFAYFFNTTKEGDVVTGGQWGSSKVTRLAGDMASFTDSSGIVSYLRAADTIVGLGKQSPELRAIWEKQYGFKLPSFAVGTPFVPQDMIAQIHKGEAIMPAPVAQRWRETGGDSALMQEMLMETKAIRNNSDKVENRIYKLERIVDDWDRNGVPTINQPGTVLEVTP